MSAAPLRTRPLDPEDPYDPWAPPPGKPRPLYHGNTVSLVRLVPKAAVLFDRFDHSWKVGPAALAVLLSQCPTVRRVRVVRVRWCR